MFPLKVDYHSWRIVYSAIALMAMLSPSAFANPWSRALGDARSVQHRTEDIADRLNRKFSYSQATSVALYMDNAACQLVDAIKCGASWQQVQGSLSRTCAFAYELSTLVDADCNVRNDRRTLDYVNDLSKRIERLRCHLDKAFEASQPKFCPPPVVLHRPSWNSQLQPDPFHEHDYPRDTYDFDSSRYDERPVPFGYAPETLPQGRLVGPIEYRVERNVPSRGPRTAAFVQLGLEAVKLIGQNR